MPGDDRVAQLLLDERQVFAHLIVGKGLVIDAGVDAERAGVGTTQTADHGHHAQQTRFVHVVTDELPALAHAGQEGGLTLGRETDTFTGMGGKSLQNILDQRSVGKAEDVVEVSLRIVRVRPGVGAAEDGDHALLAVHAGNAVGEIGRRGKGAQEKDVDIPRQVPHEVLGPGIGQILGFMTQLLDPHPDGLGHDRTVVGLDDSRLLAR